MGSDRREVLGEYRVVDRPADLCVRVICETKDVACAVAVISVPEKRSATSQSD
jgi:hypothetical protein